VRVLAMRYPYRTDRYCIEGTEVITLGGADRRRLGTAALWQRTLATLRAEHARRPFDVLHAFWATESGLLAALAGRLLGVPALVSLAGGELVGLPDIGYGDQRIAWERLKVRLALRLASAVAAGSTYLQRIAERFRPAVLRLPLGVDTALFHPGGSPERLLHVGTLTPVKDQRTLLHALAQTTLALDIVGDGPLRPDLERLASTLGLNERVRFHGDVDHARLAPVYQAASALVVSSRHEAQCMVALEAAACGVPVLGTRVGVLPELSPNATVAVGDAAALAQMLNAPPPSGTHDLVQRDFALDVCARNFVLCYERLIV